MAKGVLPHLILRSQKLNVTLEELNVNFCFFYASYMCIHIAVKSEVCSMLDNFMSQSRNFPLSFPV